MNDNLFSARKDTTIASMFALWSRICTADCGGVFNDDDPVAWSKYTAVHTTLLMNWIAGTRKTVIFKFYYNIMNMVLCFHVIREWWKTTATIRYNLRAQYTFSFSLHINLKNLKKIKMSELIKQKVIYTIT